MSKEGFYLKKLLLKGENKLDAEITFTKGLNVISGSSDSGKSYIYECIDYMLGGSSSPKDIDEANGYNDLYLEIHIYSGKSITFFRQLNNSKVYYSLQSISASDRSDFKEIQKKHNKDNVNNISTILQNAAGIKYKYIVKNKSNITESFTYRTLSRLNMLNEEKIITKESPINDNGNYTKTKYESALRAMLTGRDDLEYCENQKKTISRTRINGQLDLIELLKKDESEKLLLMRQDVGDDIQSILDELESISNNKNQQLSDQEDEYQRINDDKLKLSNTVVKDMRLRDRFKLLKRNYRSDVMRLDFIDESHFYMRQMVDVRCPVCDSDWDDAKESQDSIELMAKAVFAEKQKIELQIEDLDQTIRDINQRIDSSNMELRVLDSELDSIQYTITNILRPIIEQTNDKIMSIVEKQVEEKEYADVEKRINDLDELYSLTKKVLDNVKVENKSVDYISESILSEFSSVINDILVGINFYSKGVVEFNKEKLDLLVNNSEKDTFGKGSRAIINSAYLLGIMKYTTDNNLKHPNFVLLDSPLTTYKEKDEVLEDPKDVLDSVKNNFYNYINREFSTSQVIILDNVEPPENLKKRINYIHFTSNPSKPRTGFIPI